MAQLTPTGLVKILGLVTLIMVVPMVGGSVVGMVLDGLLGTSPLLVLSGLAVGKPDRSHRDLGLDPRRCAPGLRRAVRDDGSRPGSGRAAVAERGARLRPRPAARDIGDPGRRGGLLLDNWLHTTPIFTLMGMVLGIGAAMYTIWDVARQSMGR